MARPSRKGLDNKSIREEEKLHRNAGEAPGPIPYIIEGETDAEHAEKNNGGHPFSGRARQKVYLKRADN